MDYLERKKYSYIGQNIHHHKKSDRENIPKNTPKTEKEVYSLFSKQERYSNQKEFRFLIYDYNNYSIGDIENMVKDLYKQNLHNFQFSYYENLKLIGKLKMSTPILMKETDTINYFELN